MGWSDGKARTKMTNREIDALVDKHIFGIDIHHVNAGGVEVVQDFTDIHLIPDYSTNIADAWEVVEKMECYFEIMRDCLKNVFVCRIGPNPGLEIEYKFAPKAICLAALKAKGVEVESE